MSHLGSAPVFSSLLLLWCCFVGQAIISTDLASSHVKVDGNGRYQDVRIAVSYTTEENENLLLAIQDRIRTLSRVLHRLLGLQFGNVTILIPSTWQISYPNAFTETTENSDILVRDLDVSSRAQHVGGCGKEALGLLLNTDYVQDDSLKDNLLLHDWLHKRYGVFDEHPVLSAEHALDKQTFYHSSASLIEPVRCSQSLSGPTRKVGSAQCEVPADVDYITSLWKSYCKFELEAPDEPTASIMYSPSTANVNRICNSSTHNHEAPNRHNRLCHGRSVMDVLQSHIDFEKGEALHSPYQDPQFAIRKQKVNRMVVFVVDYSDSMEGVRFYLAKQAISSIIDGMLEDTVTVMILTFDGGQRIAFEPTEISSDTARQNAIEALNSVELGPFTCIGCALREAYNKIDSYQGFVSGSHFVLLTDGEDNKDSSLLRAMYRKSEEEAFFIDTILLTDTADDTLLSQARTTGSRAFSASEDSAALIDAFTDITATRQGAEKRVIQVSSVNMQVSLGTMQSQEFYIDSSLSESAEVTVYWSDANNTAPVDIQIFDKNGWVIFDSQNMEFTSVQRKMGFARIPIGDAVDRCQPCRYVVQSRMADTSDVIVTVNGRAQEVEGDVESNEDTFVEPIVLQAYVDAEQNFTIQMNKKGNTPPMVSLHALVSKAGTPVTSVDVTAYVTFESLSADQSAYKRVIEIKLHDSGAGADVIKGDGIYSAYFANFQSANGTYYVRMEAKNSERPQFMRYASSGFFAVYISDEGTLSSILPPAAVMDLQVQKIEEFSVSLTFTAPGEDYDLGQALSYEILTSPNLEELRNYSSIERYSMDEKPQEAGSTQEIQLSLDLLANQTVWLAVITVDSSGLKSNLSNVVSALYIATEDVAARVHFIEASAPNYLLYIIIASMLLLLVLLIGLLAIIRKCKTKENDEEKFYGPYNSQPSNDFNSLSRTSTLGYDERQLPDGGLYSPNDQIYATAATRKKLVTTRRVSSFLQKKRKSSKRSAPQPDVVASSQNGKKIVVVNFDSLENELEFANGIAQRVVQAQRS